MTPMPLELAVAAQLPLGAAPLPLTGTLACAMDRHVGPYESLPELAGWIGADWCRCRCCGSAITRATTRRNAA